MPTLRTWFLLGLCASVLSLPLQNDEEIDGEISRKVLGSSVVTSVSVIMNDGTGSKTYFADAVGKPVPRPSSSQVASPINLLNPDRYEFYTFDDSGDLVKRLMTLEEIQGIIAGGDGEGAFFTQDQLLQGSVLQLQQSPELKMKDVVANVQHVMKEEMEQQKLQAPNTKPILDTPDVSGTWSMILPAIFGNTGGDIIPDKHPQIVMTPETELFESSTKKLDDLTNEVLVTDKTETTTSTPIKRPIEIINVQTKPPNFEISTTTKSDLTSSSSYSVSTQNEYNHSKEPDVYVTTAATTFAKPVSSTSVHSTTSSQLLETTNKPIAITESVATPTSILTPQSVTANKITTTPKPITTPEAVTTPKRLTTTKPITTPQAVTVPKRATTTKPITTPKPITTSEAIPTSEAITTPKLVTTSKPITTTEAITTPKLVTTSKPITTTETITTPKLVTTSKPITTTEAITTPKLVTTSKPITTTEAITTPKLVTTSRPITTPTPITTSRLLERINPITTKSTTPKPITSVIPIKTTTSKVTTSKPTATPTATSTPKATIKPITSVKVDPIITSRPITTEIPISAGSWATTPEPVTSKLITTDRPITTTQQQLVQISETVKVHEKDNTSTTTTATTERIKISTSTKLSESESTATPTTYEQQNTRSTTPTPVTKVTFTQEPNTFVSATPSVSLDDINKAQNIIISAINEKINNSLTIASLPVTNVTYLSNENVKISQNDSKLAQPVETHKTSEPISDDVVVLIAHTSTENVINKPSSTASLALESSPIEIIKVALTEDNVNTENISSPVDLNNVANISKPNNNNIQILPEEDIQLKHEEITTENTLSDHADNQNIEFTPLLEKLHEIYSTPLTLNITKNDESSHDTNNIAEAVATPENNNTPDSETEKIITESILITNSDKPQSVNEEQVSAQSSSASSSEIESTVNPLTDKLAEENVKSSTVNLSSEQESSELHLSGEAVIKPEKNFTEIKLIAPHQTHSQIPATTLDDNKLVADNSAALISQSNLNHANSDEIQAADKDQLLLSSPENPIINESIVSIIDGMIKQNTKNGNVQSALDNAQNIDTQNKVVSLSTPEPMSMNDFVNHAATAASNIIDNIDTTSDDKSHNSDEYSYHDLAESVSNVMSQVAEPVHATVIPIVSLEESTLKPVIGKNDDTKKDHITFETSIVKETSSVSIETGKPLATSVIKQDAENEGAEESSVEEKQSTADLPVSVGLNKPEQAVKDSLATNKNEIISSVVKHSENEEKTNSLANEDTNSSTHIITGLVEAISKTPVEVKETSSSVIQDPSDEGSGNITLSDVEKYITSLTDTGNQSLPSPIKAADPTATQSVTESIILEVETESTVLSTNDKSKVTTENVLDSTITFNQVTKVEKLNDIELEADSNKPIESDSPVILLQMENMKNKNKTLGSGIDSLKEPLKTPTHSIASTVLESSTTKSIVNTIEDISIKPTETVENPVQKFEENVQFNKTDYQKLGELNEDLVEPTKVSKETDNGKIDDTIIKINIDSIPNESIEVSTVASTDKTDIEQPASLQTEITIKEDTTSITESSLLTDSTTNKDKEISTLNSEVTFTTDSSISQTIQPIESQDTSIINADNISNTDKEESLEEVSDLGKDKITTDSNLDEASQELTSEIFDIETSTTTTGLSEVKVELQEVLNTATVESDINISVTQEYQDSVEISTTSKTTLPLINTSSERNEIDESTTISNDKYTEDLTSELDASTSTQPNTINDLNLNKTNSAIKDEENDSITLKSTVTENITVKSDRKDLENMSTEKIRPIESNKIQPNEVLDKNTALPQINYLSTKPTPISSSDLVQILNTDIVNSSTEGNKIIPVLNKVPQIKVVDPVPITADLEVDSSEIDKYEKLLEKISSKPTEEGSTQATLISLEQNGNKQSSEIVINVINNASVVKEDDNNWKLVPTMIPHNNVTNDKPAPIKVNKIEVNYGSYIKNSAQETSTKIDSSYVSLDALPNTPIELNPAEKENNGLEESSQNLGEDMTMFADLCNELAFKLWNAVTSKGVSSARSIVVSPFAVTSLLAMMFMGARGSTSGEMNDILKLDDMVTFNPHLVFKNITESVEISKNSGVAVSAFVRELFSDRNKGKLLGFYKQRAQQFYGGHVEEVNYNVINDIIRRRTNLLVKRQTWGKVPEYLKSNSINLRPPLAAMSANVFQTDCSLASTKDRDGEMFFVVLPSIRQRRLVPVPAVVWRSGFLAGYDIGLDATVVALGKASQTVSTIFVLPGQQGQVAPGDDLEKLEHRLTTSAFTQQSWSRLMRTLIERPGLEVQIPRFSHRSVVNATTALQKMGLSEIFNPDRADLRGLNGVAKDLYFSDMLQINTFTTCGEDVVGDQHHIEFYPATGYRSTRDIEEAERGRLYREALFRSGEIIYDENLMMARAADEPRDYQRAFKDPVHDSSYLSLPLPLRPRQARQPDEVAPRLRLDRPFLYFVRHNPTGIILHMGRFNPRLLP